MACVYPPTQMSSSGPGRSSSNLGFLAPRLSSPSSQLWPSSYPGSVPYPSCGSAQSAHPSATHPTCLPQQPPGPPLSPRGADSLWREDGPKRGAAPLTHQRRPLQLKSESILCCFKNRNCFGQTTTENGNVTERRQGQDKWTKILSISSPTWFCWFFNKL